MSNTERKVDIEKFRRPTNYGFIARIDKVLNLSEVARNIEGLESKYTFFSQVNRHSEMTSSVSRKAQAEDVGEMFNEMWYIIGVALGKFPADPHKKFKYFYTTEEDRLKDPLEKLEGKK